MKENRYQRTVENICVPAGLEERVLSAARRQGAAERAAGRGRFRPVMRAAVCAVCALTTCGPPPAPWTPPRRAGIQTPSGRRLPECFP